MPEELREDFRKFRERVTTVESAEEGSFKASADAMSDEEADGVLSDFFRLAEEVAYRYASSR